MAERQDHAPGARHFYRIYGLTIASDLPLPEATALGETPANVDVHVELGTVPLSLPGGSRLAQWLEVKGQTCLLNFEGLGRFFVEHGRRIVVEKDPVADFDDLRGFLFGSGFGALLHQRGLVPLHVSAVVSPLGVIAFTGESGAGKSTLAAQLNQELGWPLICDDVAVLHEADDGFYLESGVNTVKLWDDALRALGMSNEGLRRDLTRYDKFHAVNFERFSADSALLRRLVLLDWRDTERLEAASGRRAYQIVLGAVYRPAFAALFSNRARVSEMALRLSPTIDVKILSRRKDEAQRKLSHALASNLLSLVL